MMQIVSDERDQLFTVTEMADLLFNQTDSASCYAAHRLLSEDRRYFKQAGRNPPLFAPRSPTEVTRFKEQAAAEQRVSELLLTLSLALIHRRPCIRLLHWQKHNAEVKVICSESDRVALLCDSSEWVSPKLTWILSVSLRTRTWQR